VLLLAFALPDDTRARPSPSPQASPSADASPSPDSSPAPRWHDLLQRELSPLTHALGLAVEAGTTPAAMPADSRLASVFPDWPSGDAAVYYWSAWPRDGRVLLGSPAQPILVEFSLGHGQVIALADATWLTNAGLARGERLRLALHLLRASGRPILFDEYRHGLAEQPGLAYVLARYGLVPTAFCALLFLALVAWRTTPAEAPSPAEGGERMPVRDSLIEARAGLYVRTLRSAEAARLVERELRSGLAAALAQPLASWDALRRRLGERRPALAGQLDSLRRELEAERRDLRGALEGLVPLMRRVARFIQEVR